MTFPPKYPSQAMMDMQFAFSPFPLLIGLPISLAVGIISQYLGYSDNIAFQNAVTAYILLLPIIVTISVWYAYVYTPRKYKKVIKNDYEY